MAHYVLKAHKVRLTYPEHPQSPNMVIPPNPNYGQIGTKKYFLHFSNILTIS